MEEKFDLFVSYAHEDFNTAMYVVNELEKRGKKCFIAPRNIRSGYEYAVEIIRGISNSIGVLIVFSNHSDKSGYCLREANSAISRNKKNYSFKN